MADESTPSQEKKVFSPRITKLSIVISFLVMMGLCMIFLYLGDDNSNQITQSQAIVIIFLFILIFFYYFHWQILHVLLKRYWKRFNKSIDLDFEKKYIYLDFEEKKKHEDEMKKHEDEMKKHEDEMKKHKRESAYIKSWSYLLIAVTLPVMLGVLPDFSEIILKGKESQVVSQGTLQGRIQGTLDALLPQRKELQDALEKTLQESQEASQKLQDILQDTLDKLAPEQEELQDALEKALQESQEASREASQGTLQGRIQGTLDALLPQRKELQEELQDALEKALQESQVALQVALQVAQRAPNKEPALFIVGLSSVFTAVILTLITVVLSILFFSRQDVVRQALLGAFIIDFMSLLILFIIIGIPSEHIVERLGDDEWKYLIGAQILLVVLLSAASSISAILIAFFNRQIEDSRFKKMEKVRELRQALETNR